MNKQKREKMSEAGFNIWKEKYSWEKISLEYEKVYKQ